MRGNPDKIKDKTFRERPEAINRKGAPPKTMTLVLNELKAAGYERVTPAMVVEAYEILLGLPESKIKEIITDPAQMMSLRIVGKAMLSVKGAEMLEKMLDRAHGKATQKTEVKEVQEFGGVSVLKESHLKALEKAFGSIDHTSK